MASAGDLCEFILDDNPTDVDMGTERIPTVEIDVAAAEAGDGEVENDQENGMPFQEESLEDAPARPTYIDYLRSPVIGLLVGQGDEQALLTAHQALLTTSPWFADACAKFSDELSVSVPLFLAPLSSSSELSEKSY